MIKKVWLQGWSLIASRDKSTGGKGKDGSKDCMKQGKGGHLTQVKINSPFFNL